MLNKVTFADMIKQEYDLVNAEKDLLLKTIQEIIDNQCFEGRPVVTITYLEEKLEEMRRLK